MTDLKTNFGAQTPKYDVEDSDADYVQTLTLINSIMGSAGDGASAPSPSSPGPLLRRSQSAHRTPERQSTSKANSIANTPSSEEIDLDLEKINSFCDAIDHNLLQQTSRGGRTQFRSTIDVEPTLTSSAPINISSTSVAETTSVVEIIDLSDTTLSPLRFTSNYVDSGEDDIITVSSNLTEVIDLCTPHQQRRASSRVLNRNRNIVRRSFPLNDLSRPSSQMTDRGLQACNIPSLQSTSVSATSNGRRLNATPSTHRRHKITSPNKIDRAPRKDCPTLTCPVCMDSVLNRQPTSTKCGHVFCANCIHEALQLSKKCPMCNTKLNPRTLFRLYL